MVKIYIAVYFLITWAYIIIYNLLAILWTFRFKVHLYYGDRFWYIGSILDDDNIKRLNIEIDDFKIEWYVRPIRWFK